jgi:predicted DNA-binding transcriptional regulator AlpA
MPRKAEAKDESGVASVRAVDRAIAILQCFTPDQPALSVIEIQKRVGLSRPTLYRLLQTLAQRDLIDAKGEPQRFRLSHGVMKLSHVWLKGLDVVTLAHSVVEDLRDMSGETAALFKLQEDRGVCILECESRHVNSCLQFPREHGALSLKLVLSSLGSTDMRPVMARFLLARSRSPHPSSIIEAASSARLGFMVLARGLMSRKCANTQSWCARLDGKSRTFWGFRRARRPWHKKASKCDQASTHNGVAPVYPRAVTRRQEPSLFENLSKLSQ